MSEEEEKPRRIIDFGDVMRVANQDEIWALRGKAIGAYSNLEQSLSHLFCALLRAPPDRGSMVFFKITSTQTRNAIFDKLLHKEHGSTYNLFWTAYWRQMRSIDIRRNEIVHWAMTNQIDAGGAQPAITLLLKPPTFWDMTPTTPSLGAQDLIDFAIKCNVYARLANMFVMATTQAAAFPDEQRQPWLDIFQQPLVYPLPAAHPLNTPPPEPYNQPQS